MRIRRCYKPVTFYFLILFMALISDSCLAQGKSVDSTRFERRYRQGDEYRYRLTCEEYQNGKWSSTTISICRLRVVADGAGIPYDEVSWLSVKRLSPRDTIDETVSARSVQPYRISLHPKGSLALPKLDHAEMTEPITDFNTFFVAIAPTVGVRTLARVGDSHVMPFAVTGDFSNGKTILTGQDCLLISVKLLNETKQNVYLQTAFLPPSKPCFSYLIGEMSTPVVADTVNNFQMSMPAGDSKVNLQYGREFFYINSHISKADGKIESAEQYNALSLKMKINCDSSYQNCQVVIPFSEERKVKLQLLTAEDGSVNIRD